MTVANDLRLKIIELGRIEGRRGGRELLQTLAGHTVAFDFAVSAALEDGSVAPDLAGNLRAGFGLALEGQGMVFKDKPANTIRETLHAALAMSADVFQKGQALPDRTCPTLRTASRLEF